MLFFFATANIADIPAFSPIIQIYLSIISIFLQETTIFAVFL